MFLQVTGPFYAATFLQRIMESLTESLLPLGRVLQTLPSTEDCPNTQ